MSEQLKACPFCGGKRIVRTNPQGMYSIRCKDCGVTVSISGNQSIADRKWNTRTPSPSAQKEGEYEE